ncbi:MAG: RNA polymerase sigma factor [Candidatus Eremiobacterota bacterium]
MWNEEELIEAVARGEEFALELLFERHYSSLWKYILVILKNPDDTKEVINETFFLAFRQIRYFRKEGTFSAWLFRIARNLSIDYLKKRKFNADLQAYNDVTPDPMKEKILEELEYIKTEYRDIIMLKDISGYTMQEIAQMMNITVSAAKTLHHRAIKKLKERCLKEGEQYEM